MSKIRVQHTHTLSAEESRSRIAPFEENLAKYGANLVWTGNRANVKGTGFSGAVTLEDQVATVELKLGMLAKAVGVDPVRLEGSIQRRLADAFAVEEAQGGDDDADDGDDGSEPSA